MGINRGTHLLSRGWEEAPEIRIGADDINLRRRRGGGTRL